MTANKLGLLQPKFIRICRFISQLGSRRNFISPSRNLVVSVSKMIAPDSNDTIVAHIAGKGLRLRPGLRMVSQ
jgi:hypothetical protein